MTVAPPRAAAPATAAPEARQRRSHAHYLALGSLLALTAALYLVDLGSSGWANAFYSAAAQAGADDWTAMLFGSSDAANAITVDKTPAALWVMDVSVRLFGLNPWSVLAPQALMGVASVAVLYAAVKRAFGPGAALLAGAVLALTPAAALMFRFNNPDALLVLALVVGAYCVQRACEPGSGRWWMAAAGAAVGFGFLAKMAQALLVLPGFGLAFLVCAAIPLRARLLRLSAAVVALIVSAGWYLALVELWPASSRPYIGGSQHNSIVELALGYNGFGRLTGDETGGLGNMNFDVGWDRLFGPMMGTHAAWLLPAALIGLVAGLVLTRRGPLVQRAALISWGGWLVVTAAVFSYANGIVHPYYTVALAPAAAACVAIGATLLWRARRNAWAAAPLSMTVAGTAALALFLLRRHGGVGTARGGGHGEWLPWLGPTVAVVGVGAAVALLIAGRLPSAAARAVAGVAVLACLAAPAAYSVATAASEHRGAIPTVGPAHVGFGFGPPAPRPGGPPGPGGGPGGFGGGLLSSPEPGPALTQLLTRDAEKFTWTAAVVGSNNAAGYQLASGAPVMAVGGFNGTDPAPSLVTFQRLVADGRIHYFIQGGHMMGMFSGHGGGSRDAALITEWVERTYAPIRVDGVAIYDLTAAPTS